VPSAPEVELEGILRVLRLLRVLVELVGVIIGGIVAVLDAPADSKTETIV